MSRSATEKWLAWYKPNPRARLRLFCFPYGGGAAGAFRTWQDHLPSTIEVCPVQIPGREGRLREPCYTRLNLLVEDIAQSLFELFDKPFAFFGHSLGTMIEFDLARHLRNEQLTEPVHLFASGRRAPQIPDDLPCIYNLQKREFIEALRQLNTTNKELLANDELLDLIIPILKADYEMVQTYSYRPDAPFDFSITALGGKEDLYESAEKLEAWRSQTRASFSLYIFPGDHFFIHSCQPSLLQTIAKQLHQFA